MWVFWHGRVQSASHTQFILRTGKKDEPGRQSALSTKSRWHEVDCWGGQCFRSSFGGGRQQDQAVKWHSWVCPHLCLTTSCRPSTDPTLPNSLLATELAPCPVGQSIGCLSLLYNAAWVPIPLALEPYSFLKVIHIGHCPPLTNNSSINLGLGLLMVVASLLSNKSFCILKGYLSVTGTRECYCRGRAGAKNDNILQSTAYTNAMENYDAMAPYHHPLHSNRTCQLLLGACQKKKKNPWYVRAFKNAFTPIRWQREESWNIRKE